MKLLILLAAGWMVGGGLFSYCVGRFMAWGLRDGDAKEQGAPDGH